ncbi:MAG: efflux RND transporter periplasmic adaptor subunit [Planctomycetes bacterium]|nr:efflux RND transporter periplasmic adaptor subunit [Planctomycetota bacterium]
MSKKGLIIFIILIVALAGIVVFVPQARDGFIAGWNWVFGSPKALEAGYYYTCPMHPEIHLPSAGDCPICGMSLVKKESGKEEEKATSITLSGRQVQIGGIRTEAVKKRGLVKTVDAIGKIDYDERARYAVSARVDGRVDKIYVNFTGATIKPNQAMVDIYSPQLVSAQKEYLLSLDTLKSVRASEFKETVKSAEELVEASRQRLLLWGITPEQVSKLEKTREVENHLTIYSQNKGTIITKNIVEGQYVKEGDVLFETADLSNVWLYADIYEQDIPLLAEDSAREAEITSKAFPGEIFSGRIEFTYPFVNPETRTMRIRITIPNPHLKLRPEMFANARIKAAFGEKLAIPESAVVYTGKRNIVFMADGAGVFTPTLVSLGAQWLYDKDFIYSEQSALPFHQGMQRYHEVLGGVKEGDIIVTSGNFLVDAESQIQGALQRFLKDLPAQDKTVSHENVKPSFNENDAYVCPMKCESSDKPGKCSKCGMNLVPNTPSPEKEPVKQENPAEKDAYICPMHPDVISDKPGKCPKCGMNLVPNPKAGEKQDHSEHNH